MYVKLPYVVSSPTSMLHAQPLSASVDLTARAQDAAEKSVMRVAKCRGTPLSSSAVRTFPSLLFLCFTRTDFLFMYRQVKYMLLSHFYFYLTVNWMCGCMYVCVVITVC